MILSYTLVAIFLLTPALFAHDDLHEQIARVTALIAKNPGDAALYIRRGELHRAHRAWDRAMRDYDRAQRLDKNLDTPELCRGRVYFDSGRLAQAQKAFESFLTSKPAHSQAHLLLARTLVKLRHFAEAAHEFERAIDLDAASEPERYVELAQALIAAGEPERALRGLDQGIEKIGSIVTLQQPAIELEISLKRFDRALARIEKLTAQSERKETWLATRAEVLESADRTGEAAQAYEAAIAAIETLPASRRSTISTRNLESRLRIGLKRVTHEERVQ